MKRAIKASFVKLLRWPLDLTEGWECWIPELPSLWSEGGTFCPTALNSRKEKGAGGWIYQQWPDDLINLLKWKTLIKFQRIECSELPGWWPHGDSASMLSSERAPCSLPKPFPTLPVHLFHLNVPELCPLQESLFSWTPKSLQTVIAWNQKMPASWRESYDKSRQCINKQR